MKTLFLNPNGSDVVTRQLHDAIAAAGGVPGAWEVCNVPQAPAIIASAGDDRRAEAALVRSLPQLLQRFDRIVLMSSVDTGYGHAARLAPGRVFGFTGSVLALHAAQGRRLQAITFGGETTPLYEAVFARQPGVVERHEVFAAGPLALAGATPADASVQALARQADALHARSPAPVFLVGAVVLPLVSHLRAEGRAWIVDPVADLLAGLRRA